jgi:hypothetical protein
MGNSIKNITMGIQMTRTQLLQSLIKQFNYSSYLEIGCANDWNFNQIPAKIKVGVEPHPHHGGTHKMTSDEFFKTNDQKFDLIFIDGLHISDQVDKDIENSLKFLNDNGTIVMHDCSPAVEEAQRQYVVISDWNGDVWKSFVKARSLPNVDAATGNFDHGCGVLRVRKNTDVLVVDNNLLTWDNLVANRQQWLRLKTFDQLLKWVK